MVNPQDKKATDVKVQDQICFLDIRGTINFESVPERTIVKQIFYVVVLKRCTVAVRR
jgi:hypothetical protein